MLNPQPAYGAEPPLFSVIIPLEYHRGQWEQSWKGWTSQTVDKSLYEIILAVAPDFSPRENLVALADGEARLEFTDTAHDTCLRFAAGNDSRRLGLPVEGIEVNAGAGAGRASSSAGIGAG